MNDVPKEVVIEQLVGAIADVEESDPESLDISVYDYVSTDAIRDLVAHESDAWRLQFETQNHVVEVTGNNIVLVDGQRVREVT